MGKNNKRPIVSIVIPIYNAESWLHGLHQTFEMQTEKSFEVIFVEDCSTDNSAQYLRDYFGGQERYKILNRKVRGGTASKGVEYALPCCQGEYYFYMSQDDFIDCDFMEKCIKKIQATKADIVFPNVITIEDDNRMLKYGKYPIDGDYSSEISPEEAFLKSLTWKIQGNALIKMSLLQNEGFKARYYNSDEFYTRKIFGEARKLVFCDTNFYYRRNNPDAITRKFNPKHIDILTTDILLAKLMISKGYKKDVVCRHLQHISKSVWGWFKTCIRTEMEIRGRIYMGKELVVDIGRLILLWIKFLI